MSTISMILEPDPDGSLHLPLPPELRGGMVKIEARLEPAPAATARIKVGLWKDLPGPFWMSDDFEEPLADFKDYMG